MQIIFTRHAQEKFDVLKRHGFFVTKSQVISCLKKPEIIDDSRLPLLIAQQRIDATHVLRVVYKISDQQSLKIITFYPGRRKDYEPK